MQASPPIVVVSLEFDQHHDIRRPMPWLSSSAAQKMPSHPQHHRTLNKGDAYIPAGHFLSSHPGESRKKQERNVLAWQQPSSLGL
jgi:hypothetical protein